MTLSSRSSRVVSRVTRRKAAVRLESEYRLPPQVWNVARQLGLARLDVLAGEKGLQDGRHVPLVELGDVELVIEAFLCARSLHGSNDIPGAAGRLA